MSMAQEERKADATDTSHGISTTTAKVRARHLERMTADYWRQINRTGGAYIPPKRLAAESAAPLPDRSTEAYQRLSWDALRRSINGLINKVSASNLAQVVKELVGENLIRGRGLFARALMKAQAASPIYTPVYAALLAVLNTKFPMLGELITTRLICQFRRSYRRNDKTTCVASTQFLAHLVNQRVLHDICILQLLMLLLERPTDDSVEIAVAVAKEVGAHLSAFSPKPANAIFERFRVILHEGAIDRRVQYMVEVLFQIRKEGFETHPAIRPELDLVEEADQTTHYLMLDDEDLDAQDSLNIFRFDPEFETHEAEYEEIKREIIGDDQEEQEQDEETTLGLSVNQSTAQVEESLPSKTIEIKDQTGAQLVAFRRTVYLTIQSSLNFEECGHKLLKMNIPPAMEVELVRMIVECAANEKQYLRFHGLLAERFCKVDPRWREHFERVFAETYKTMERFETNAIRNVARLFAHLFESDAITWAVLECVKLTEEETTAEGRIFLKFFFQDLAQYYGVGRLGERLREPDFQNYFSGIFPLPEERNPHRLHFSINFFTAIDLGPLTDAMREQFNSLPEVIEANHGEEEEDKHHNHRKRHYK